MCGIHTEVKEHLDDLIDKIVQYGALKGRKLDRLDDESLIRRSYALLSAMRAIHEDQQEEIHRLRDLVELGEEP